jgi:tetratricopeptide (TPR) repeat protein
MTGVTLKPRHHHVVSLAVLALLAALSYGNSLDNELIYGDKHLIVNNALIKDLKNVSQLLVSDWWAGTDQPLQHKRYRPLVTTTFALNHAVGGNEPFGYHLVNVFLHLGVCWLLYLLALELGLTFGGSLASASLFAVHPLHTEAVVQASNRTELMMAMGVLASIWLYARSRRALSLAAYGLAMLSKEQGIMVPILLAAFDMAQRRVPWSDSSRLKSVLGMTNRYGPYAGLALAYLVARASIVGGVQPPAYPFLLNPLEHVQGSVWFFSVLKCAGHYLWIWLWPATLRADYSFDTIPLAVSMWDPGVMWGILAWGGLIGLAAWSFRRDRRITFCVGLTALAFLPVSNLLIPIGTPVAERLFYLPSAGLCLLVGLGLSRLTVHEGIESPWKAATVWPAKAVYILVPLLCLVLVGRTVARNHDWTTEPQLFRSMVRDAPRNAKAHTYLGDLLVNSDKPGDWDEALREYQTAMGLYPEYFAVSNILASHLGLLYLKLGRIDDAIAALQQAVQISPAWSDAHYLLGRAYALRGNSQDAVDAFQHSLALRDEPEVRTTYSRFLIEQGRFSEGLMEAELVMRVNPDLVTALYNRALALDGLKRHSEAIAAYQGVLSHQMPPHAKEEVERRLETLLSLRPGVTGLASPTVPGNGTCAPGLACHRARK